MKNAWLAVSALVLVGCDSSPPPNFSPVAENQVTEKRDPIVSSANRRFGDTCEDVGPGGCAEKICLYGRRGTPRFCSRQCSDAKPCPNGFGCVQVYPTDDGWFCSVAVAVADGGAP